MKPLRERMILPRFEKWRREYHRGIRTEQEVINLVLISVGSK